MFEVDQFASYHHSDDKMRMMMTGTMVLYAKHKCSTKDKQFDKQTVKSSGVQSIFPCLGVMFDFSKVRSDRKVIVAPKPSRLASLT